MSRERIYNLCASLSSNKIKDRNDSLLKLQDFSFASPSFIDNIDKESLLLLIDSLGKFIITDKIAFEKSANVQIELRLSKASNALKLIISKVITCPKFYSTFKSKHLEQIVRILINNFTFNPLNNEDIPLNPVILNLTNALIDFLNVQYFMDCIQLKTHSLVINNVLKLLSYLAINKSNDENLFCSLFEILLKYWHPVNTDDLNILLSDKFHNRLLSILMNYLNNIFNDTKRERSSLIGIFKLINCSIVHLSTENIKLCHRFTKIGLFLILEIKSLTFPNLLLEISLFFNICYPFIYPDKLPKLNGDNWNINSMGELLTPQPLIDSSVEDNVTSNKNHTILGSSQNSSTGGYNKEILDSETENNEAEPFQTFKRKFDDYIDSKANNENSILTNLTKIIEIVTDLLKNNQNCSVLSINSFNLFIQPLTNERQYDWFTKRYFSLKSVNNELVPWLMRIGLGNLIDCYYKLKNNDYDNSDSSSNITIAGSIIIKKRKTMSNLLNSNDTIFDILLQQSNSIKFLISMAETNRDARIISLQTLSLYLAQCASSANLEISYNTIKYALMSQKFLLNRLINLFEIQDDKMNKWILLNLKLLFDIISDFKMDLQLPDISSCINKIMKYCLEFLKDPLLCKWSCTLLNALISKYFSDSFKNVKLDKSIIQQYETVIDLSEISGPAILCKESILFWILSLKVVKNYKFQSIRLQNSIPTNTSHLQLYSHKIITWLLSKESLWLKLEDSVDILIVSQFIFWLLNNDSISITNNFFQYDDYESDHLVDINSKFNQKLRLINCILLERLPNQLNDLKFESTNKFMEEHIFVSSTDSDILMDKLREFTYNFNEIEFNALIASWVFGFWISVKSEDVKFFGEFFDRIQRIILDNNSNADESHIFMVKLISRISVRNKKWIDKLFDAIKIPKLLENVCNILTSERNQSAKLSKNLNNFDSQLIDEEFVDNDNIKSDSIPFNPNIYNRRMHSVKLDEQIFVKAFLLAYSAKKGINNAIKKVFNIIWHNKGKQLSTIWEILDFINKFCHNESEIEIEVIELIINNLTQLLQIVEIMRYEQMVVLTCKILTKFTKNWIQSRNDDLISDCFNIYSFFNTINSKNMMYSEIMKIEFFTLNFNIIKYFNDSIIEMFDKDELVAISVRLFQSMSNYDKFLVSSSILNILALNDDNFQLTLYSKLSSCYDTAQQSAECCAAFNIYMGNISKASDTLLIATICNLIEFSDFDQMKAYFCYFQGNVLKVDIQKLFWNLKVVFFKQFCNSGKKLIDFPYDLFGFSSSHNFYLENNKELTALTLIYRRASEVENIAKLSNSKIDNLLKDSFSYILSIGNETAIKLLEANFPKFSKSMKNTLKEQIILVVFQLLKLCDCSAETALFSINEENFENNRYANPFLLAPSSKINFLKEYDVFLSPIKCNYLILSNMNQAGIKSWSIPFVYHLVSKLLLLLKSSVLEVEKKLNIRRLKFLFTKCPESFTDLSINCLIIQNLWEYLKDQKLRDDVAQFIYCLLKCKVSSSDSYIINTLIPLVSYLLKLKNSKSVVVGKVVNLINEIINGANFIKFSFILDPCMQLLKDRDIEFSFEFVAKIIKCNILIENMLPILEFLSLLFKIDQSSATWDIGNFKSYLSYDFIQRIFDIQLRYSSVLDNSFKVWIGRCLAKFYELTGDCPKLEDFEFDKTIFKRYSGNSFKIEAGLVDYIFDIIIRNLPNSSLHSKLCFESITGVIIDKHRMSLSDILGYISYDRVIEPLEDYIYPMTYYVCSLSVTEFERNSNLYYRDGLVTTLNGFGTSIISLPLNKWLTKIVFSIINELNTKSFIFTLLATYISQVPDFVLKCFCPLVLYFIHNNTNERNKLISNMVVEMFEQDFSTVSVPAIELFCELALLIRAGTKVANKDNERVNSKFLFVYNRLNIPNIFHALEFIGKNKAAYLLMEEYYMSLDNQSIDYWKGSPESKSFMKKIYEGIDETDLMLGLPVDPDLEYGLNIIKNNNVGSAKLMFENAKVQIDLKEENKVPITTLNNFSNDLMKLGWQGVSKILSENIGVDENENDDYFLPNEKERDNNYAKLWKLNQWDLPATSSCLCENEAVYNVFKSLNEKFKSSTSILKGSITNLIDNYSGFMNTGIMQKKNLLQSWMKSLCIINGINDIIFGDDLFEQQILYEKNTNWIKYSDLDIFENLLVSRQILYEIISNNVDSEEMAVNCWILEVNELDRFSKLMASKNETQRAINTAVHLDKISKKSLLKDNQIIKRVSNFNLALAFWAEHSETAFPVSTLKTVIENSSHSYNTQHSSQSSTYFMTAVLAKWLDESKQDTAQNIILKYIDPTINKVEAISTKDIKDIGEMYRIFAEFCDKQVRSNALNESIKKLKSSISLIQKDIYTLSKILKSSSGKDKHGLRHIARLKGVYGSHKNELKVIEEQKESLIKKAISFYLKAMSFDADNQGDNNVDRFCALWIENHETEVQEQDLMNLPCHKFLPWNNQLTSRLLSENNEFQRLLKLLITNIAKMHPFQTLYLLKSLRINKLESPDATAKSRGDVAESIWKLLMGKKSNFNVKGYSDLLGMIDSACDKIVEIATYKSSDKRPKTINVSDLKSSDWWLEKVPTLKLPLPVMTIPVKYQGFYDSNELITIIEIDSVISVASSGVSAPKIMKLKLSNGQYKKMLFKSPDDLRQDAIMQQVFAKVNKLLNNDIETKKRNLNIRTYNVLPLGPQNGVIEFVSNSTSMMDIMYELHGVDVIQRGRKSISRVEDQSIEKRRELFEQICEKVKPKFRFFFLNNFVSSDSWFTSRVIYSHGLAVTCIIGYVLGIGDRHCNNILIDESTGEPIQIDFGVVFDQGKLLPIPETVPFRLTRELVDGLGITGVDGIFSKSSEHVFRVMRSNKQYISGILDVLKYDPLYQWALSPLRKKKLMTMYNENENDNGDEKISGIEEYIRSDRASEANTAIETVITKLNGNELSNEAIVRELIREATSVQNLSVIFCGWSAFL